MTNWSPISRGSGRSTRLKFRKPLKPFDPSRYEGLTESEKTIMGFAAFALMNALSAPDFPARAISAAAAVRRMFHDKPYKGDPIPKGRKKLAFNLSKGEGW